MEDIIEPISRGMREMTSGPREMAKMREDLEVWRERRELGEAALKRLDPLLENAKPGLRRDELEDTRRLWTDRQGKRGVVFLADFAGGVASRCNVLERLIQKTCVEVCNEQGWVIPFTQITVHQASKLQKL